MATRTFGREKPSVEQALKIGVAAVDQGDLGKGKAALSWVLKQDPNNTTAWLWMACCLPDDSAKQECYRRVSLISTAS
jgi:Tfp pilus assembly protein PilF